MVNEVVVVVPPRTYKSAGGPGLLERYRAELSNELHVAIGGEQSELLKLLRYHLGWVDTNGDPSSCAEGKAIRPALCLFTCEAVGCRRDRALPAAAALELIHNFTLLHDDIQDGDVERRHRSTVWYVWGKPRALIAGNTMRVLADAALMELSKFGASASSLVQAAYILNRNYLEVIEGQYLDLSFEDRINVSTADYLDMIGRKTGALMEASMHLGACLGTKNDRRIEALRQCGRAFGSAFQIRDDILGIWGDEVMTGKAAGADIRRKKKSFPAVYALEVADGKMRQRLLDLYSSPGELASEDVTVVLDILEEVGARKMSQRLAEEQCSHALKWMHRASLPSWAQTDFEDFTDFILHRTY